MRPCRRETGPTGYLYNVRSSVRCASDSQPRLSRSLNLSPVSRADGCLPVSSNCNETGSAQAAWIFHCCLVRYSNAFDRSPAFARPAAVPAKLRDEFQDRRRIVQCDPRHPCGQRRRWSSAPGYGPIDRRTEAQRGKSPFSSWSMIATWSDFGLLDSLVTQRYACRPTGVRVTGMLVLLCGRRRLAVACRRRCPPKLLPSRRCCRGSRAGRTSRNIEYLVVRRGLASFVL
jgi:hypothetical protein